MNGDTNIKSRNIIETVLVLFLLLALLVALYEVLYLFFGVLTFALVFAISFETFFEWMVRRLKNKRKLAAFLFSLLLIAVIAVPLSFLFSSLARNAKPVIGWINDVKENGLPPLPVAITKLPLVGGEIANLWNTYHDDPKQILIDNQERVQEFSHQAMTSGFNILGSVVNVLIGIIISSLLLFNKENILSSIRLTLQHLVGKESGVSLLEAIAMAIKGVSIGVMGTAFIAAFLSFIGLEIAGIHFAVGLSVVIFFLVVIQIGPLPLWIPLVIWMSTQNHPGLVVFLIIWGVAVTIVDAIIKPILIGKSGGKLPFLVLFIGVIGGLSAWGFTGMFKGAIIVAVFYTIYNKWLTRKSIVPYEKNELI